MTYRPRPSVRALAKQYKDYGRWRRVVTRYHRGSVNLRYLAPPTALLAFTLGLVLGVAVHPAFLAVPGAYVLGIVGGAAVEGRGLSFKARALLPVAFATMHLSWGFGFLTSPRSLARRVIGSVGPASKNMLSKAR